MARLREEAASCTRCPLYANATQAVFGEGRLGRIMLIGEQPGDQEDRAGRPFVGPAGRLLHEVLKEAGIDPRGVYLTNAVSTSSGARAERGASTTSRAGAKFVPAATGSVSSSRRCNRRSSSASVRQPAQALLGRDARVGALRGEELELARGQRALVTIHPSAVLRSEDRDEMRAGLLPDLELARDLADAQTTNVTKS